jgi:hypothetical protein
MRNQLQLIKTLTFAALMFFSFGKANASHFMGGDITYVCIGPNQYSIVAKLFRDCNGIDLGNTISVNIASANCGYNQNVTLSNLNGATNSYIAPLCDPNQDACTNTSGVYGVEQYFYRGIVTLPTCLSGNDFVISWSTCCRNTTITTGAANAGNWLYVTLNNTLSKCNSSPAFNFEPTVYLCLGQKNHFNNGVTDIDGDRLQFSLTNCLDNATTSVNYNAGFSATNPLTNSFISIDAQTGQFDITPTALEVGVICIMVEEFRSNVKISETIRDLQFTVVDCGTNNLPVLSGVNGTASSLGTTGSYSYTACVGENIKFDIASFDAQGQPSIGSQNITMEWGIGISKANFIIDDTSSTLPSATFRWTPTAADVGTKFFTVKIQDDACIFNGISVFTYKIIVQASGLNYSPNMPTDTTVCDTSGTLVIDVNQGNFGPGYKFFWSTNTPDSVLSCYICPDPVFTPIPGFEADYEFYMVYRNVGATTNCVERDTFRVHVDACVADPNSTNPIDKLVQQVSVYPNPLTTNALLTYNLNQRSDVMVEVYDILGKRVGTLANETQNAGEHQIQIGDAISQVKGIYFVRLLVDGQSITKKIVVQ